MTFRILNAAETRAALPMADAIAVMREAFSALARGAASIPLRTHMPMPVGDGLALVMPGVTTEPPYAGAKLLTLMPENAGRGRPVIHGVVVMFDEGTGEPAGLVEGKTLTALRTGAVSGLATDLLARRDARRLGVIGSGPQARTQIEAVCAVRPIERIRVYSRTPAHARRFVESLHRDGVTSASVAVAGTAAEASDGADVICTATSATQPVLGAGDVADGAHINAIGSYTLEMRELAPGLVHRARIVVDLREAALAEAGELVAAIDDGTVDPDDFVELGELVEGGQVGRREPDDVTLFKSVGLAVQDLCAAGRALQRAAADGIGTEVRLDS